MLEKLVSPIFSIIVFVMLYSEERLVILFGFILLKL